MMPTPNAVHTPREKENLTPEELKSFMDANGISIKELAELLGVTERAVKMWLAGDRDFSVTNTRLVKMFQKYPALIREF